MIDRTDEETGELVREWLQRYGLPILAGIVLAIALIAGYQWWQRKQLQEAGSDSAQLISLNHAVEDGDIDKAKVYFQSLEASKLQPIASLLLATAYATNNQSDEALNYYQIAAQGSDPLVAQTAHWQLAQTHIAAQNYSAAEHDLQALKGSAYDGQIALLRAVMAQRQGDHRQALQYFRQAASENEDTNGLIQAQIVALEGELAVGTEK